ncbi:MULTISPECIES: glutathione synthase [Planktothrix]|jgi:glutathione synthase|uniref:Glutathione synthetase n=8 Tax=Planktothrix agardhii TaxID=1160 RepID=A0A073CKC2_PLAA1|nr:MULTISPECIES: glutathione synthase [Planktothrix]AQY60551.1 GshB [Planktothrix agardhii No66]AQY60746.1 GshB [Planktothrix agardhii No365]AQY61128.1 Glutathione synthetase [Planktothrix agardhii NIVA-CYA 68]CAD5978853.1 Glutathione synthetase [Planktothrix rubescens]BBD53503.1 glutathione synthetase [Planktothrix agardhii NIES-204]
MKFAFIIDPIEKLNPSHDSSVALMEAAQLLGHEVWVTQAHQLNVIDGQTWALLTPVNLTPIIRDQDRWRVEEPWFSVGQSILQPLENMDSVFMRTDPPVTIPYLYATYLLDYINPEKTLVVNSPHGLRTANEKMYALQFKDCIPTTIVSRDKQVIREFVERQGAAVLKPLGGKAGEGILFLEGSDRNLNSLIEISTQQGIYPVMIQTFLPEAKDGDKRIIVLNGEPIGAVNRIPTGQEFRGNMAVGGRVAKTEITDREREICQKLASKLVADGLYFVGIDIIGGYLTEVNVTSPTGIREIDLLDGVYLGKQVIEWVENKITNRF